MSDRWTEFHRQEDEAIRSSPLYDYAIAVPGLALTLAGVGVIQILTGRPVGLVHLVALVATGAFTVVWGVRKILIRRRERAASRVIFERSSPPPRLPGKPPSRGPE